MAEIKTNNLVSYIALGISVVALAIAVFGGCNKKPHFGFGGERGPRPEITGGHRGGEMHGPNAGARQGFDGERGSKPDAKKPQAPKPESK